MTKRFDSDGCGDVVESDDGEFVLAYEYDYEVDELQRRVRWLESVISGALATHHSTNAFIILGLCAPDGTPKPTPEDFK